MHFDILRHVEKYRYETFFYLLKNYLFIFLKHIHSIKKIHKTTTYFIFYKSYYINFMKASWHT